MKSLTSRLFSRVNWLDRRMESVNAVISRCKDLLDPVRPYYSQYRLDLVALVVM